MKFFKKMKHWLWVRYMRLRYPPRPAPVLEFKPPPWRERPDGLYQIHTHTASPFETTETEEDYKKYPRTCYNGTLR